MNSSPRPSHRRSFRGRTALVTGASSGLGVDFAHQLAARGCPLVLVARRRERLEEVAGELSGEHGVDTTVVAMDLADPRAPAELHGEVERRGLAVDVLINNAGFGVYGDYLEIPWEREGAMIDLDVRTVAHLSKLFSRGMVERGWGRILQVASVGAYQATPTYAAYGAAKAFVLHFSEAVNFELRGTGVSSTAVSPGITATEFLEVAGQEPTLYQRWMMMESEVVARIAIRALERQKSSVVPGVLNKLVAWSVRTIPHNLATRIAWWTMKDG